MIFDLLRLVFIVLIAVPFIYMVADVIFDIIKRIYLFTRSNAKGSLVRVLASLIE